MVFLGIEYIEHATSADSAAGSESILAGLLCKINLDQIYNFVNYYIKYFHIFF